MASRRQLAEPAESELERDKGQCEDIVECVELSPSEVDTTTEENVNQTEECDTPVFSRMDDQSPLRIICSILESNYHIPNADERLDANFQMMILTTAHALHARAQDLESLTEAVNRSLSEPPDAVQLEQFHKRLLHLQSIQRIQQVLLRARWITPSELLQISAATVLELPTRLQRSKLNTMEFYQPTTSRAGHNK